MTKTHTCAREVVLSQIFLKSKANLYWFQQLSMPHLESSYDLDHTLCGGDIPSLQSLEESKRSHF